MYNNLYCKIYLGSELTIDEIYQYINDMMAGEMEPIRTIKTDWGEIDLRKNSDFKANRLNNHPNDFIFWNYYLDIKPNKNVEESAYITHISNLLSNLRLKKIKAIASCDFEKEIKNYET